MAVFLIAFEFKQGISKDITEILNFFRSAPDGLRLTQNVFIIKYRIPAIDLRNKLINDFSSHVDKVFVVDITSTNWAAFGIPQNRSSILTNMNRKVIYKQ